MRLAFLFCQGVIMRSLLLASQSPRRRQLIDLVGYSFEITAVSVDETSITDPDPLLNTQETARLKARAVLASGTKQGIVVAADTTVAIDGRLLGKPASPTEATSMLQFLRGRTHQVHTGLTVIDLADGREIDGVQTSSVTMRDYTDAEIAAYVASGDPLDKAGAYAIQHPTFQPVARLAGCYTGVMGLSVCHLIAVLQQLGLPVRASATAVTHAHHHHPCPLLNKITPWLHP